MDRESQNSITAKQCNQPDQQRRRSQTPGRPNPKIAPEGISHRDTISRKSSAFDTSHDPGGDTDLDDAFQLIPDDANWVKKRSLRDIRDSGYEPASRETECDKNADEKEQAPTAAQASRTKEDFFHA